MPVSQKASKAGNNGDSVEELKKLSSAMRPNTRKHEVLLQRGQKSPDEQAWNLQEATKDIGRVNKMEENREAENMEHRKRMKNRR